MNHYCTLIIICSHSSLWFHLSPFIWFCSSDKLVLGDEGIYAPHWNFRGENIYTMCAVYVYFIHVLRQSVFKSDSCSGKVRTMSGVCGGLSPFLCSVALVGCCSLPEMSHSHILRHVQNATTLWVCVYGWTERSKIPQMFVTVWGWGEKCTLSSSFLPLPPASCPFPVCLWNVTLFYFYYNMK